MTTKEQLELLSNYTEVNTLTSNRISYLTLMDDSDMELQMRIKSQNRELAIDALIEGKEEEYKNRSFSGYSSNNPDAIGTISPRIVSIALKNKIVDNSHDNIFINIVSKLENLTSGKSQFDINFSNFTQIIDSNEARFRKIVTTMMRCSSLIAIDSRMGHAHSAIIGTDIVEYFLSQPSFDFIKTTEFKVVNSGSGYIGNLSGMSVFTSDKISKDKVILTRGGKSSGEGLNIVNELDSSSFYIEETPSWKKYTKWFSVT